MAEIIGYIGRAQTLSAELSTPQTITGSLCGGASHGIPSGGEPGQGLIKVSDTDYYVKWMDILPEDTASGSVASFPDGADDLPMGVVVDIDPVQEGSGDPSPDNIRPISGRTGAKVYHSGADTSNPTEYEIPFSTSVYGGKLNVETGECVVDRAYKDGSALAGLFWSKFNNLSGATTFATTNNLIKQDGRKDQLYCNLFPTVVSPYFNPSPDCTITNAWARGININIRYDAIADYTVEEFKQWMIDSGLVIVYGITPITLTLDPVEIRSLLGDNNVWADTGDVSVTYKADVQKYIDKKISAAVAAMS